MNPLRYLPALFLFVPTLSLAEATCEERVVSGHHTKMCRYDPGMFRHWTFSLEVDNEAIFSLIDDYVEQVSLTHTVPEGLALELPLSQQGKKVVTISGGCVPEISNRGTEVARTCNFTWGDIKIVDGVRFVE